MGRIRYIKPGFFTNEELASLPPLVRLLFAGLWTIADKSGRLEDRPKRIKAELFAYDDLDVDAALHLLHERDFITRYRVKGDDYIAVNKFGFHQHPHPKEKESTLPKPPKTRPKIKCRGKVRASTGKAGASTHLGMVEPGGNGNFNSNGNGNSKTDQDQEPAVAVTFAHGKVIDIDKPNVRVLSALVRKNGLIGEGIDADEERKVAAARAGLAYDGRSLESATRSAVATLARRES